MTSPYRDENASLRAENERLRAELSVPRRSRGPLVVAATVVAEFAAVVLLRGWLNAEDDLRFWSAIGIVVALGAIGAAIALAKR